MDALQIAVTGLVAIVSAVIASWTTHLYAVRDTKALEARQREREAAERVRKIRELAIEDTRNYYQAWFQVTLDVLRGKKPKPPEPLAFPHLEARLLVDPSLIECAGAALPIAVLGSRGTREERLEAQLATARVSQQLEIIMRSQRERVAQGLEPLAMSGEDLARAVEAEVKHIDAAEALLTEAPRQRSTARGSDRRSSGPARP